MDTFTILETCSIGIVVICLSIASVYDVKTREVPDKVWSIFAPIGLGVTLIRCVIDPSQIVLVTASVIVSIVVSFGLVFSGLFGGADAKALITVGLAMPLAPVGFNPVIGYVHPFFPILALLLGFLCSLTVTPWVVSKNIVTMIHDRNNMYRGLESEPNWKKALAFFVGFPTSISHLKSTFYLFPIEEFVSDENRVTGKLRTYVNIDVDRNEQVSRIIKSLPDDNSKTLVWVTPILPMILFLLFGAILALLVGDPIFGFVLLLTRQ